MKQTTILTTRRWIAKSAIIASFLIGATFFFGVSADAITIAPARFDDVTLLPGTTIEKQLTIFNETTETKTYTFVAQNFGVGNGSGAPEFFTGEENAVGLASWIHFDLPSITLSAGETKTVPFSIEVSGDAKAGGYSAAVFLAGSGDANARSAVGQVEKIGALVLGNVPGEVLVSARIEEFRGEKKIYSELPQWFSATIENAGGANLRPEVAVAVVSVFGKTAAARELNAERGYILPGSKRTFDSANEADPKDENFFEIASRQLRRFAAGPYKATLWVEDESIKETAQFWIWVFPWQAMTILAGLAGALFLGQKFLRRWMKKRSHEH